MTYLIKTTETISDFPIDWADEIGDDAVATNIWSVFPAETGGLIVLSGSENQYYKTTWCTVTGGITGHVYQLTNRLVLTTGKQMERTITIRIGTMEASG